MPDSLKLPYTRLLDPQGCLLDGLPAWADDPALLVRLYRQMVLTRLFDQKAVALQRTGRIGTYAPTLGQEAIGVAIGALMQAEDVLVPYYRDTAVQLMRGVKMEEILLYWGGDERGSAYADPAVAQDFPLCVPIATQALHACGVASAFKIRGEHRVAVTTCGDGATSKGDFLEALNVAGAWQLPVVFVVNNNQWAISVPRRIQCGAPTLAQKALGAGFPGEQVDGNDVLAVYARMQAALERARHGKGPVLLECLSYRLGDHTTADDATRYRSSEEVKQAWQEEPIKRLQLFMVAQGLWDERREQALIGECQALVQQAVEAFEAVGDPPAAAALEYVYAQWPAALVEQREMFLERATRRSMASDSPSPGAARHPLPQAGEGQQIRPAADCNGGNGHAQ
jgi:2-oxoisovalerate dehydrogenase E1 component alpha subunit